MRKDNHYYPLHTNEYFFSIIKWTTMYLTKAKKAFSATSIGSDQGDSCWHIPKHMIYASEICPA